MLGGGGNPDPNQVASALTSIAGDDTGELSEESAAEVALPSP